MNNEVLRSVIEAKIFFFYAEENYFGNNLEVKKVKDVTEKELFC